MARSTYIYHVFHGTGLMVSFTVKYEAVEWAKQSPWALDTLYLMRGADGNRTKRVTPLTELKWPDE